MSPHGPDMAVAIAMDSLIERGRAALTAHVLTLPMHERIVLPVTIDIVLEIDFVTSPGLCLQHATHNGRTVHVLCRNNAICALLQRVSGKH